MNKGDTLKEEKIVPMMVSVKTVQEDSVHIPSLYFITI